MRYKLIYIILSIMILICMSDVVSAVLIYTKMDNNSVGGSNRNFGTILDESQYGFIFETSDNYTLRRVNVSLRRTAASGIESVKCLIYDATTDTSPKPTGQPLANSTNTIPFADLTLNSYVMESFEFNGLSLTSNKNYSIVLVSTNNVNPPNVEFEYGSTGTSELWYDSDGQSTWTAGAADSKGVFETYSADDVDNCSTNSLAILNVTFMDFDDTKQTLDYKVNLEYTINGTSNNYSTSATNSNFSLCTTATAGNVEDVDLFIEYINNSVLHTYYLEDTTLNSTIQNVILRLTGGTADITATVYDYTNNYIEGAYIRYFKYDVDDNSYKLVGIGKTNFEGVVVVPLKMNTEFYKFLLYYPYSTLRKETVPTYIQETSINFQISTGADVAQDFYNENEVDISCLFNNDTDTFRYTFSDQNALVTQGCVKVYSVTPRETLHINTSCATGTSGTALVTVTPTNDTTYLGKCYLTIGGTERFMSSDTHTYQASRPVGISGLFVIFIMTIMFAFVLKWSIELGVIMIPLPLLFGTMMGFTTIPIAVCIALEISALVLSVVLNKVFD